MENKISRIEELTPFTFMLSVLVVIIHNSTSAYFDYGDSMDTFLVHYFIHDLMPLLTSCAVPCFFIISSFLFFRNYTDGMACSKLHSRLKTLVVPYLIWNTYGLLVAMAFHLPMICGLSDDKSNPYDISMILQGIFLFRYSPFWFVFALIIYNLFCAVVYAILKKSILFLVLWGILYCVLGNNHFEHPFTDVGYVCEVFNVTSVLYYLVGAYLGVKFPNIFVRSFNSGKMYGAAVVFGGISFCQLLSGMDCSSFWFPLFTIVKCFALWVMLRRFCGKMPKYWWLNISFFVYAVHGGVQKVICTIVRLLICKVLPIKALDEMVCWMISVSFTIVFIIFVAKIWKKYSCKSFAFCTGGRT